MQLIRRHHREASIARNLFGEIRDLGARLEHLTSRYERLVDDLESAGVATASELQARVRMTSRELSSAAMQLQQLLVEKYESANAACSSGVKAKSLAVDDMADSPFHILRDVASA